MAEGTAMADQQSGGGKSRGLGWIVVLALLGIGVALQLLAPTESHGDGGHHGFVFNENGFYIFDFLVLVVAIVWFVRSPLRRFLRQRRAHIEREIDEARRLQAEARETLETYRGKLANLDAEVERIKKNARQDAEALKARIIADAEAQAKKLLEDAEARVRQETHLLRERLEAELIAAAAAAAEDLVAKGLTPDRQRQFVREYVSDLEKMATVEKMATTGDSGRA